MKRNGLPNVILTLTIPSDLWRKLLDRADRAAMFPGGSERVRIEKMAVEVLEAYVIEHA